MKTSQLKRCRICGSLSLIKKYNLNKDFSIYNCKKCNTDLLYPIPTKNDIKQTTDQSYFEAYSDKSIKEFKIKDFNRMLGEISKNRIKSVLEVGCANAYIVEHLLKNQVQAFGIELFPEVARMAQKRFKDKRIYVGKFERYQFKKKFDLIIMLDLIEHLENPMDALKKAKEILNPDGHIIILTPDITSFSRTILGKYWTAYYIEHINCFSPITMKFFANTLGLKLHTYKRFHKTVNLHYFIRHLFHKFPIFKFLNFLTKFSKINFNFQIDDSSMLVILKKL